MSDGYEKGYQEGHRDGYASLLADEGTSAHLEDEVKRLKADSMRIATERDDLLQQMDLAGWSDSELQIAMARAKKAEAEVERLTKENDALAIERVQADDEITALKCEVERLRLDADDNYEQGRKRGRKKTEGE